MKVCRREIEGSTGSEKGEGMKASEGVSTGSEEGEGMKTNEGCVVGRGRDGPGVKQVKE